VRFRGRARTFSILGIWAIRIRYQSSAPCRARRAETHNVGSLRIGRVKDAAVDLVFVVLDEEIASGCDVVDGLAARYPVMLCDGVGLRRNRNGVFIWLFGLVCFLGRRSLPARLNREVGKAQGHCQKSGKTHLHSDHRSLSPLDTWLNWNHLRVENASILYGFGAI